MVQTYGKDAVVIADNLKSVHDLTNHVTFLILYMICTSDYIHYNILHFWYEEESVFF